MSTETVALVIERVRQEPAFAARFFDSPLALLEAYDLTEAERRELVLPNFGWLIDHKVASASRPGNSDAFDILVERGIAAIVCLAETSPPRELTDKHGMRVEHLPLADFSAPTVAHARRAVAVIDSFLDEGRAVLVHCGAGLGRTGTILACYLVSRGTPAADAIEDVRARRPGSIETPEQETAVGLYEHEVSGRGPLV